MLLNLELYAGKPVYCSRSCLYQSWCYSQNDRL